MLLGRQAEIAKLDESLARCRSGKGGAVVVHGEPGIGKTALAAEIARLAAASGARVYWGRCREDGGSPDHWPWVQVLRALADETEPIRLASAVGRGLPYLLAAVPEIAERLPEAKHHIPREPAANRFAFFDAVETLLRQLADDSPLVLVLDDLHAADASSLALCDFLAPGLAESRVLLVATYRDREAESSDVGATIASIARYAQRIRLSGLGREALAELVSAVSGRAVPAQLVTAIHEATEGNPLFASEIARGLASAAEEARVRLPPTVEHVLAARLAPISPAARETLAEAAVIGRDFDVALVRSITQKEATEIFAHLDEAIGAGVVRMAVGLRGEAAFAHAVYREFFYGALSPQRRAELHRDAAGALEVRDVDGDEAAIVFHLFEAGSLGDIAKAAAAAERAGERALERFAFADAARHFEDALRALGPDPDDDPRRCDLWLRVAGARFRAGAGESCKQAYRAAGEIALARRDGTRLARVGLGLAGPWSFIGGALREDVVKHLTAALEHLGPGDDALRARVLAALSLEFCFVGDLAHPDAMGRQAVELARASGDERALADVLLARRMSLPAGPRALGERIDLTREASRLAEKLDDPELAFHATFFRIWDSLQLGDADAFERSVAAAARIAAGLRQPFYRWFVQVWHALAALIEGRLADAERLVDEALRSGQRVQGDDEAQQFAIQTYQAHLYFLRRDQGSGLADLEPGVRAVAAAIPIPLIRCFLAELLCEIGRPSDAQEELASLAEDDFAVIRDDVLLTICLTVLAEVSADLGDRPRARILYERLVPFAAEHVSQGAYYNGAVAYHLGRLAATLGRTSDAKERFESALRAHRRMGARCWLARTELHYALLLSRGSRGVRRARSLAADALDHARELGMATLVADAERLLRALGRPAAQPRRRSRASQR